MQENMVLKSHDLLQTLGETRFIDIVCTQNVLMDSRNGGTIDNIYP